MISRIFNEPGAVMYAFNPVHKRQRQATLCKYEASLDYIVISRTVRSMKRNPVPLSGRPAFSSTGL